MKERLFILLLKLCRYLRRKISGKYLVYVSGPYTAKDETLKQVNISNARLAAIHLWRRGHFVICPHLNSADMEHEGITYDHFLNGDIAMLIWCDAIYLLNGWSNSKGAFAEYVEAKRYGLLLCYERNNDGRTP